MQSSDLTVMVEPADTLRVDVESTVKKQYEHLIRAQVAATLKELGVTEGHIQITDRGALDYAIAARVQTALQRASQE